MHLCGRLLGGLPQACGPCRRDPADQDLGFARLVQGPPSAWRQHMSRRPYVRKMQRGWWLGHRRYVIYMIRELTSLFVALYAALLVVGLVRLAQGRVAWEGYV